MVASAGNSAGNKDELLSLMARVCDGRADADEVRRLDARLASDPRVRQLWLEYVSVHGGVAQHLDAETPLVGWQRVFETAELAEHEEVEADPPLVERPKNRFVRAIDAVVRFARSYPVISYSTALFVVCLEVAILALVTLPNRSPKLTQVEPEPEFVARLTSAVGATWAEGQIGAALGSHAQTGQLFDLRAGMVQFTYDTGAKVVLEGPTQFRITSSNSGRLQAGKLTANVPATARGFTVETKHGRVIDLGTRFAVEVSPQGKTAVHCFRGEVVYVSPKIETVRLEAGQAIEHAGGSSRKIVVNAGAFVHDLRLQGHLQQDTQGLVVDARFLSNAALGKPVTQSTTHGSFAAALAVDGNPRNFTHTTFADKDPWLMVDLLGMHDIDAVIVHNRDECCGERLRDIVIEILAGDGQTIVYTSPKLNENNQLAQPPLLAVGLPEATGDVVRGRFVRIRRQIVPGESNDNGVLAKQRVLSVGEVQIFAIPSAPKPAPKAASAPVSEAAQT